MKKDQSATTRWLKDPLVSFDPAQGAVRDGGLVVSGGKIIERPARGAEPVHEVDEVIDLGDLVLLPGLINTHHHFYQTLTRSLHQALDKPLFPWLESLYPTWAGLTEEMIAVSTELACSEMLLSGCTTSVDHHYVFSNALAHAIDRQAEAAAKVGLRVVLTRGSMSLGESAGGLPPDSVVQDTQTILADSERLVQRWHDAEAYAMCQVALAPCSPFSVTPELLRETAQLAAREQVLLHTHLSETEDENAFCLAQFGRRPVDHMAECDWLQDNVWFAHGIHFTDAEIDRLGVAGCGVSHCPSSNMLLSSGTCKVPQLRAAGVRVGLGLDGSASNDASNMIQEVRQALLIQRLALQPAEAGSISHLDALAWATRGGAELLNRPELGSLAVGAAADIALFSLDEPRFSSSDDPLAALVLCGAHKARHVMVNGRWRVFDDQLVDGDIETLMANHRQLAEQLWAAA